MGPLTPLFRSGCVWLPRLGLWLDPHAPQAGPERVFVSHAHSDHIGDHREVILSDVTARLMAARLPGERVEHRLPFGERREFTGPEGAWHVTLVPAGHIFGSAMAFLEAGGETLLYTGDFKLRPGLSAEPCAPRRADTLVMETTYGRPEYRFPPTADVMAGVVRFCREALDNDETPVLLGYSLGKSQEILRGLSDAGLPLALHPQVARLTRIYEECGQAFPPYGTAAGPEARGRVVIAPPGANLAALFRKLGPVRQAVLSGWAVNPGSAFRSRADAAFPLSDHADFPDLVEFVRRVGPRRVFTLHGFAADFAAHLRTLGYEAFALSESDQLELPIVVAPPVPPAAAEAVKPAAAPARPAAAPGSFRAFAETCTAIGATTSKLEKTARLAAHLRAVPPAELAAVTTWCAGAAFPPADGRTLQAGWSVIRRAVCEVAGVPEPAFRQTYLKHGDTGATVAELLAGRAPEGVPLTVADVIALFDALAAARGPHAKSALLAAALRRADADEARFLVKIITGDLRIGLKEGLVEEAVAAAFGAPVEAVRRAGLLLGHPAEAAVLARAGRLHEAGLVPFRPVKVMLASPEPTAEAILARVREWTAAATPHSALRTPHGEALAWLEDKYDGIRAQLHKAGGRLALYSRDLKDVTAAFGELAAALAALPGDAILDGELLAMRDGRPLPFAALQRRLGRREGDLFLRDEVPVEFVAFDLLWRDGRTLIDEPLARRRAELERLAAGVPGLSLARVTRAADAAEIEAGFAAARARGHEGLIVKSPASPYTPGRRGLTWLKLKKAHATLDCVVVGAEYGHGKRNGVLSDYTFAVRDEATGGLKTIGKAYSGLTDAEIAELTAHFLARVRRQRGRHLEVEPDTVLEIAFDTLQPSPRAGRRRPGRRGLAAALRCAGGHAGRRDAAGGRLGNRRSARAGGGSPRAGAPRRHARPPPGRGAGRAGQRPCGRRTRRRGRGRPRPRPGIRAGRPRPLAPARRPPALQSRASRRGRHQLRPCARAGPHPSRRAAAPGDASPRARRGGGGAPPPRRAAHPPARPGAAPRAGAGARPPRVHAVKPPVRGDWVGGARPPRAQPTAPSRLVQGARASAACAETGRAARQPRRGCASLLVIRPLTVWPRGLPAVLAALLLAGCGGGREPSGRPAETGPPWFAEVAAEAGMDFRHESGHQPGRFLMPEINAGGVGLLDFDNDGLLDVFLVNGGFADPARPDPPGHRLYRNLGGWRFEDVTARAGVGGNAGYGLGVACADYDGDGWTDLHVLNLRGNVLLRNRGDGTFEDVTARAGVAGDAWSSSAAFLDYDGDGHLDLFVVNYLHWSVATEVPCFSRGGVPDYCSPLSYRAPAMDRLYRNRGDGTFEDVSLAAGLNRAFGNGLGVATGDFDRDGRVDLFVANDATPNQLWRNLGGGRFEDVAPLRGAALNALGIPRAGMGVVAVDLLQRGWLDLFVTHLVGEGHGLFLNTNGWFADVITPRGPMLGSRAFTGFGVAFRDFDHDGEPDLYIANGRVRLGAQDLDPQDPYVEPNSLLRGLGGGEFAVVSPPGGTWPVLLGASRGAAFGDLDNDGAEDVVVVKRDGPVHLLRNIAPRRGAWIGLDVRDARGQVARNALVRLAGDGRTQWRQVQPNEGYASSNDPRLIFGLGAAAGAPGVQVRWTDGLTEEFGPLPDGRWHRLERGRGAAVPGWW